MLNQKGVSTIFVLMIIVIGSALVGGGYILGSKNNNKSKSSTEPTSIPSANLETKSPSQNNNPSNPQTSTIPSTSIPKPTNATLKQQVNGSTLTDIKFILPQGWSSKLNEDSLFVSPNNGGGFLSIKVYDYQTTVGRREYYCQISKLCIEGTTYFSDAKIGNIFGYIANASDNSGGGPEYFGSKGNKFYIISTYSPPAESEYGTNFKNVINSLIF